MPAIGISSFAGKFERVRPAGKIFCKRSFSRQLDLQSISKPLVFLSHLIELR